LGADCGTKAEAVAIEAARQAATFMVFVFDEFSW